jgi:hypothetical protein
MDSSRVDGVAEGRAADSEDKCLVVAKSGGGGVGSGGGDSYKIILAINDSASQGNPKRNLGKGRQKEAAVNRALSSMGVYWEVGHLRLLLAAFDEQRQQWEAR